jgi:hypothetical protein
LSNPLFNSIPVTVQHPRAFPKHFPK